MTATRIQFGPGVAQTLPEWARRFGSRPFLVHGKDPARHAPLLEALREAELSVAPFSVSGEPSTDDARQATEQARAHGADVVIGLGGGSAVDLGKAVSGLLGNGGDPLQYLEVVGQGKPLLQPAIPYLAVPTTAGTGAEVTKNAVLDAREHGVKVSLRSERLLPQVALVDPELTLTVPPSVTASTGFDALAQVIEPFLSCMANPMTDGLCREGIARGARSLLRVFKQGDDRDARHDMALTSLLGGMALANAKLGAVHGFAGPLGGMFKAPHGALCAALLPASLAENEKALARREPHCPARAKLDEVGRLLTGRPEATSRDAVEWCRETKDLLQIPGLASYGIGQKDFPTILSKAGRSSSMKGNPIELSQSELQAILEQSL